MDIVRFEKKHIKESCRIALANYEEERRFVPSLPPAAAIPDLSGFAENGLGVAAFDRDKMLGYLCCFAPRDNAFDSCAKGTFSPIHANGTVKENRGGIYQRMYQEAAKLWVEKEIAYHSIALYAHDTDAIGAFFSYGFGLRCIDAVRPMEPIHAGDNSGILMKEVTKEDAARIRPLQKALFQHLGQSPCFMESSEEKFEGRVVRAEKRKSKLFTAEEDGKIVAFLEAADSGENFATEASDMMNVCGAYCLPQYRGRNIVQGLLNHVIKTMKNEGYTRLGVDFEGFNPTGARFWLKYFDAYTNGLVRRIDECALRNIR